MIEPFYKRFLVNESLQPLLDLCNHNPNYRGLVVFSYFDHKDDFGDWIRQQDVKITDITHNKFEDCYCLDNGSRIFVTVYCGNSCGRRVNGIMYHASLKSNLVDSVYNPMLIPYYRRKEND